MPVVTLIIAVFILILFFSVVGLFAAKEGTDFGDRLSMTLHFLVFVLVVVGFGLTATDRWVQYKRGQIDALTGNVKYHLVTNPDSTKTWEEK